jgi:WD40 repeat protein
MLRLCVPSSGARSASLLPAAILLAILLIATAFLSAGPARAQSAAPTPLTDAGAVAAHVRAAPNGAASTNALHFSPDGSRIASYTPAERIAVWDVETGEHVLSITSDQEYVYQTQWSPDGAVLASASVDGTVHLWNADTGERLQVLDGFSEESAQMGGGITEVWFSPDGRYLAAGQRFSPGRLVVWDRKAEREVLRVERPRKMYGVDWGPAGDRLYTAEEDGAVYAWSFPGGEQAGRWALEDDYLFDVDAADTAGDPRVAAGGRAGRVHVVDVRDGTVLHRFDHGYFVNRTAVVAGAPTVASVSSDGLLKVWDTDTGRLRFERFAHDTGTYNVVASPDGSLLATTGDDNTIRLWDPDSGALVREIRGE